jgi:hypothetical protein
MSLFGNASHLITDVSVQYRFNCLTTPLAIILLYFTKKGALSLNISFYFSDRKKCDLLVHLKVKEM